MCHGPVSGFAVRGWVWNWDDFRNPLGVVWHAECAVNSPEGEYAIEHGQFIEIDEGFDERTVITMGCKKSKGGGKKK
jgi:hypothetical protein